MTERDDLEKIDLPPNPLFPDATGEVDRTTEDKAIAVGPSTGYYRDKDGDIWFRSNGHWRVFVHHELDRKGRARSIFQEKASWTVYALIRRFGPMRPVLDPVIIESYDQIRRMWKLGEYENPVK